MSYATKPLTATEAAKALSGLGLSQEEIALEIAGCEEAAGLMTDIAALRSLKRAGAKAKVSASGGGLIDSLRRTRGSWSRWYSETSLRIGAIGQLLSSRLRSLGQLDAEYYTLNGVSDDRQTEFCRNHDGYTDLVTSWPSWLFPQFHMRCRTLLQRLTGDQVKRAGFRIGGDLPVDENGQTTRPEEGFGNETTLLDELRALVERARSEVAA